MLVKLLAKEKLGLYSSDIRRGCMKYPIHLGSAAEVTTLPVGTRDQTDGRRPLKKEE